MSSLQGHSFTVQWTKRKEVGQGSQTDMAIKYTGRKMRAKTLAFVIAGALGVSGTLAPSAMGQTVERQLPPPPPPALPSVSEYSLPPGDDQPRANPNVQGPVEENGPPPKVVTEPDTAQPSKPLVVNPVPVAPKPANTDRSAPAPRAPAEEPAPRASTPQPSPDSIIQSDTPVDNEQPQPDTLGQTAPPLPSDQPATTEAPEVAPAEASETNSIYYIVGGIFLLLLAGLGIYFWRRKTSEDRLTEEPEPTPAPEPAAFPRKPAPKIYSPPNPAMPKAPTPVSNDGFVTSKLGVMPTQPPARRAVANHLQIEFIANGASSTLLNAVLNYSVTLTNISDQDLSNIRLWGAMVQADAENARNAAVQSGNLLHETKSLAVGEAGIFSGDIRLPLNAIRPITFKSQALFIPLAHFGTHYLDRQGDAHHQGVSFIIGREYEPPRTKMAPFRLDLGPRSFGPVGQRPLTTS